MDPYDVLANAVLVIREDDDLKESFNRVLGLGSLSQQVRIATLLAEVEKLGAPEVVTTFVRLLGNDKLAHQVLTEINKS